MTPCCFRISGFRTLACLAAILASIPAPGRAEPARIGGFSCTQPRTPEDRETCTALGAGAGLRMAVIDEPARQGKPRIRAEYPELTGTARPGAALFNQAVRKAAIEEVTQFRKDAADLPPNFEPELALTARVVGAGAGVLSVQFRSEGMLGNGFLSARAVTVDVVRGREVTAADVFGGPGWPAVAIAACRRELARTPALAESCTAAELTAPGVWRFEIDQAVATLLLPGKELREIPVPYPVLVASLKAGSPVGRRKP